MLHGTTPVVRTIDEIGDVRELSLDREPNAFGQIVHEIGISVAAFNRAAALAGARMKLFGMVWSGASGKRRHGQIKHIRDLKRQFAKIEARR